jgi:hypothetical protein
MVAHYLTLGRSPPTVRSRAAAVDIGGPPIAERGACPGRAVARMRPVLPGSGGRRGFQPVKERQRGDGRSGQDERYSCDGNLPRLETDY